MATITMRLAAFGACALALSAMAPWALAAGKATAAPAVATVAVDGKTFSGDQLVSQARYWESKGRFDLARENWLKLLRGSPENPTALSGLANAEAQSGRAAAAQVYLDRLKESHPDHPDIRRIEAAIRQGNYDPDKLAQPRALARQGKYTEAIAAYKAAFNNEIPGGRMGLEYYQTLAGTQSGWDEARAGIAKLAQDNFDEPIYKLALAQHLSYREETRRQGISELMELAKQSTVGVPARQAWRQALIWLGGKAGDESYYNEYLRRFGEDAQVSAKLAALRAPAIAARAVERATVSAALVAPALPAPPTPEELRGRLVKEGFDALNDSRLEVASDRFFTALTQYGETADALGGLGIVRLRQQDYPQARDLLERAIAADKKRAARWKEALDTARFWEVVRSAEVARKASDSAEAERLLRRAIAIDPKRAAAEPSVPGSLADVLVELEQYDQAEKQYREVLRVHPDYGDALRGLIGLLARGKRLPEAIALAERAPEEVRAQLGNFTILKAQYLRDQAGEATRAKDEIRAEGLLKDALLIDPESPWTRLDLARIYQRQKRVREANTLIDGLLAAGSGPVQPEALFVKANLLAEQQNWLEGLQLLEQIEPGSRTPGMYDLQKRLWLRYQTQRAGVYSRYGQPAQAQAILAEIEPYVGDSPELLGALASGYADLGDEARAMRYIRQALTRTASPNPGLRLQYASLLFKLRQDAEFEVVMEELLRRGGLDNQQSLDLANLRIAYRLRQADLVREEGDLARAYEYLEPLIRVNPNDPRLMMALARLYNDSKDFDKAYQIYLRVIAQNAKEIDAYKGAIGAALALQHWDDADALLERAFAMDPNNPRLYALAGRAARGRGDDGRALQLFQQALRLDAEKGGEPGGNPFAGNSQPLLQLIDGGIPRSYSAVVGMADPPPRPAPAARASSFFDASAGRALRQVAKKKAAHSDAQRVMAKAIIAKPSQPSAAVWRRGDVSLPTRGWRQGRLWKTSTPPQTGTTRAATGTVERPSGYWAEERPASGDGSAAYRYTEGVANPAPADSGRVYRSGQAVSIPYGATAPAPLYGPAPVARPAQPSERGGEFPNPRRYVAPPLSQSLSRPRASLRDEVLGDIADINRQQDVGQAPASEAAPQIYYGPAYGYSNEAPPRSSTYGGGVYEVPRIDGPYDAPVPIYRDEAPRPMVAPVPEYRYSQRVAPPPPPILYQPAPGPGLRADPLLSRPELVLDRNNVPNEDRKQILKEIGELRAQRSPYAAGGLSLRSRDGVDGLDRMYDIEAPIEAGVSLGEAGRFKLRVVPVYIESGTVSGRNLPLFGAMGLALALNPTLINRRFETSDTGIAIGLGYDAGEFKADIGTSPLGFRIENLVGGVNWRPSSGKTSFRVDVSRRSVTDSVLSYAGVRDPATGLVWGGVTKTGGRLDVAYDIGKYGLYGNGSYHILEGQYVPQNTVVEGGGGFYARALETRNLRVTYGLNVTAFGYNRNLRRFSFGHGGYFSPQSYFSVAIPVEWEGFRNRFSYKLNGAIGLQAFSEDGAALYPGDSGLQSALQTALANNTDTTIATIVQGGYPARRQTGIGFTLGGQFEYLLDPNLTVGARLSLDNARDYKEASASGYLRYNFYPQNRVSNPPALLLPYYNFGDARL